MSDTSDSSKYKWTPESTALLVSVWSDRQVQKQLEFAPRPQVIWENIARYMKKKGYNVAGKQCRSRMKQVLVCYREAKRAGTRAGVEQYYETIDRVLRNKRMDQVDVNVGIDTVDSTANYVKSPPKDVKTNKNLQMRIKDQEPVQSLYRTEALSPTWIPGGCENEYPDSPESNETIVPKSYRVLSPTRDVAINTGERFVQIGNRAVRTNPIGSAREDPIPDGYRQNLLGPYTYGEIPYQNAVQNVQNQIIQENMQQYQNVQRNLAWNQLPQQNVLANDQQQFALQRNVHNLNQQRLLNEAMRSNAMPGLNVENIIRQQNQLQQSAPYAENRAVPQEPLRKVAYGQNLAYKQYQDNIARLSELVNMAKQNGSPDYSPDVSQNLNDAFCQSKNDESKAHKLNETYNHHVDFDNLLLTTNAADATVVTNNATCNDDSMLLEFLLDSPPESENGAKSRDSAVNTDNVPNAPFRKKKAQKIEQLVLSAINSQNEVVNKILAAQNDMVTRFLDVDRDRQNRLENRLDHLLNVVHATVLNKNENSSPSSSPPLPETAITSLLPPPKPGMIPPKLDLVPPKPCRVPCTIPNSNVELINQNPTQTRPGVVSPIVASPASKKLGTIWSKLGPVSTSPFVKAQQRLGFQPVFNNDARTQSSAERRIAREVDKQYVDARVLICETAKLLEMERELEERIENARLEVNIGQALTARRKLFTQREPTPMMILTAAFLDGESRSYDQDSPYHGTWESRKKILKYGPKDNILAGQGESYERMCQLNATARRALGEPCDSSTPAKLPGSDEVDNKVPKRTIQQLAQVVMNSERWRNPTFLENQQHNRLTRRAASANQDEVEYNVTFSAPKINAPPSSDQPLENDLRGQSKFPMGFTTAMLSSNEVKSSATLPRQTTTGRNWPKSVEFLEDVPKTTDRKNNVRFMDEALAELQRMHLERQAVVESAVEIPEILLPFLNAGQNRNLIERYVNDLVSKKSIKEKENTDSENDDEYLDTTATMQTCVARKGSLTSNGTSETAQSSKVGKSSVNHCRIS